MDGDRDDLNYCQTEINIANGCRVTTAVPPALRSHGRPVAIQYEVTFSITPGLTDYPRTTPS
jgi:hypothetical protein